MNYETYFTWIIILLVLLLAGVVRIYWEALKRNRLLKAQLDLTAQMAAAQGVSTEKIAEIIAITRLETK